MLTRGATIITETKQMYIAAKTLERNRRNCSHQCFVSIKTRSSTQKMLQWLTIHTNFGVHFRIQNVKCSPTEQCVAKVNPCLIPPCPEFGECVGKQHN